MNFLLRVNHLQCEVDVKSNLRMSRMTRHMGPYDPSYDTV